MHDAYKEYHSAFKDLQKDKEKITKLQLLSLLKEGQSVLMNDVVQNNHCPLCQQEKSKVELISELNTRIEELMQLAEEKSKLDKLGDELKGFVQLNINIIEGLLKDKLFKVEENEKIKVQIED